MANLNLGGAGDQSTDEGYSRQVRCALTVVSLQIAILILAANSGVVLMLLAEAGVDAAGS